MNFRKYKRMQANKNKKQMSFEEEFLLEVFGKLNLTEDSSTSNRHNISEINVRSDTDITNYHETCAVRRRLFRSNNTIATDSNHRQSTVTDQRRKFYTYVSIKKDRNNKKRIRIVRKRVSDLFRSDTTKIQSTSKTSQSKKRCIETDSNHGQLNLIEDSPTSTRYNISEIDVRNETDIINYHETCAVRRRLFHLNDSIATDSNHRQSPVTGQRRKFYSYVSVKKGRNNKQRIRIVRKRLSDLFRSDATKIQSTSKTPQSKKRCIETDSNHGQDIVDNQRKEYYSYFSIEKDANSEERLCVVRKRVSDLFRRQTTDMQSSSKTPQSKKRCIETDNNNSQSIVTDQRKKYYSYVSIEKDSNNDENIRIVRNRLSDLFRSDAAKMKSTSKTPQSKKRYLEIHENQEYGKTKKNLELSRSRSVDDESSLSSSDITEDDIRVSPYRRSSSDNETSSTKFRMLFVSTVPLFVSLFCTRMFINGFEHAEPKITDIVFKQFYSDGPRQRKFYTMLPIMLTFGVFRFLA